MEKFLDDLEIDKNSLTRKIAIFLDKQRSQDENAYLEMIELIGLAIGKGDEPEVMQKKLVHVGVGDYCEYVTADFEQFKKAWRLAVQFNQILETP